MPGKRSVWNSYSSRALKKFVKSFSLAQHDDHPQFMKLLNGFILSSTLPQFNSAYKLFVEKLRRGPSMLTSSRSSLSCQEEVRDDLLAGAPSSFSADQEARD